MFTHYDSDIIVVGGGPIGMASALFCAKEGKTVTLLERFSIGNQHGSSAGHVRMWRIMYTELNHAKLAIDSGELFRDLEQEADAKLLYKNGLLNFGLETDYTPEGTLESAIQVMDKLGKKYTRLTKNQIESRYPFKNLHQNFSGVFQEDGATIDVKETTHSLLKLCRMYGVNIKNEQLVTEIKTDANGVIVTTTDGIFYGKKMILCPGAYVNELIKPSFEFEFNVTLWEMCFAYYRVTDPSLYFPMWFQFDEPRNGHSNLFYGFPNVKFGRDNFVRFAVDWASHVFTDPSEREFAPRRIDIQLTQEYVKQHIRGVDSAPIDMASALMTHFPDNHSLLDFMPKDRVSYHKNVVICTGGWAFKFVPLFGKICAELAVHAETETKIDEFSISRPGIVK